MVRQLILLIVLLVIALRTHAADVAVSVQPLEPTANESFRLIFSADKPLDGEPDFSVLENQLDILARNRQTSLQWINGERSRLTTWILDVIAKSPGILDVPAVAFGKDRSPATRIEVKAAPAAAPTDQSDLVLEIEVDKTSPYVQEQVILTARLLRRLELNDANLTDPETSADAIIKRLGKDTTYQTTRAGKRYEAFERRFSIFPQASGPVRIEPLVLTTQIVDSPQSIFDRFRQPLRTRRIESESIELNVRPIPPAFTGTTWLPAKRINIRDHWEPDQFEVATGEPLTRTLVLWAAGLSAGQLPEIPVNFPTQVKNYPDQPQTSEQETVDGFSAIRQQKYAVIANEAGEIVFPAVDLHWWNTSADKQETARIPARHVSIQAAAAAVPPESPEPAPTKNATPVPIDVTGTTAIPVSAGREALLVAVAAICAIGWIATALAWRTRTKKNAALPTTELNKTVIQSLRRARRDVLGACQARDPNAAKSALLQWGRIRFEAPDLCTLGELRRRLDDPLAAQIRLLEEALYSRHTGNWSPEQLRDAFASTAPIADDQHKSPRSEILAPLYRLSQD